MRRRDVPGPIALRAPAVDVDKTKNAKEMVFMVTTGLEHFLRSCYERTVCKRKGKGAGGMTGGKTALCPRGASRIWDVAG